MNVVNGDNIWFIHGSQLQKQDKIYVMNGWEILFYLLTLWGEKPLCIDENLFFIYGK